MIKITLLLLQTISAVNLGQSHKGSLLTDDMFDDVNPDEFKKQLDSGEKKGEKKAFTSFAVTEDGTVDAKSVDSSNWDDKKKTDCYF
tara:strand:+ start:73 stop:333 length:261 start_codon:yes stop_codon:yes gene_type:complete